MPPFIKKSKKATSIKTPEENGGDQKLAISGQLDKKLKRSQARIDRQRGVVLIKHLPHGFFEEQLKKYFEQFGRVTRLRLARSERTGASKGYAFVEFEYPEVAKVAAETMDNYLMFHKVIEADYIPPEQQHYNYFKTSVRKVVNRVGKPIYVSSKTAAVQRKANNHNNWTDDAYQKRIAKNVRKLQKLKSKYSHLGIDFDSLTLKSNIQKTTDGVVEKPEEESSVTKNIPPGSLLLLRKRQSPGEERKGKAAKKAKEQPPKSGKEIGLKDLLEDTLKEEGSSEDEEFIPTPEDDDENTGSDEESYEILKQDNSDEDSDEELTEESVPKKKVKSFEKSSNVDRISALLKPKLHLGGIQKSSKKIPKGKVKLLPKANVRQKNAKSTLIVAAVKEINQKEKVKKFKKADKKNVGKKRV